MLPHATTNRLSDLIDAKRVVLSQLCDLARRQIKVIAECRTDDFVSLLASKQALVDELLDLETKLNPFRDQDPELRDWQNPARREHCRTVAADCDLLLKELILLERQAESDNYPRRNATRDQLRPAQPAEHCRAGYTHSSQPSGGCFDITSEC